MVVNLRCISSIGSVGFYLIKTLSKMDFTRNLHIFNRTIGIWKIIFPMFLKLRPSLNILCGAANLSDITGIGLCRDRQQKFRDVSFRTTCP